ncbi:hypothetical protein OROMI_014686 [Orobanche minor]
MGGRLELIKSVLNSIALYCLQVLKPPENVIIAIERLFNKFLWGTNDNRRRLHLAAWSRLCYPKDEGGFGCRDLHDIIRAGEIKMWWRFRTIDNIWSNFLRQKYCSRLHPMIFKLNPKSSPTWKNLYAIRAVANDKFFWHSGNGMVSFWHDRWCDFSLTNYHANNSKDTISCFCKNGKWDRRKISDKLPSGLCDHICSFPTSPNGIQPVWTLSANGIFNFKTSWEFSRKKKPPDNILRFCWNPLITPTISVFMVRVLNNWIPTPDGLSRRGIISNNACYCCDGVESLPHLFINGPVAKEVWKVFHNLSGINVLIRLTLNLSSPIGLVKQRINFISSTFFRFSFCGLYGVVGMIRGWTMSLLRRNVCVSAFGNILAPSHLKVFLKGCFGRARIQLPTMWASNRYRNRLTPLRRSDGVNRWWAVLNLIRMGLLEGTRAVRPRGGDS